MRSPRWRLFVLRSGIGLGAMACHPGLPAPVASTRTFPDVASALECARDAMASAGFLVEPARGSGWGRQDPNRISATIVTGDEQHIVGAVARVRIGPNRDTTVVLEATAGRLRLPTGEVRPVSDIALRGRDAIEAACIRP